MHAYAYTLTSWSSISQIYCVCVNKMVINLHRGLHLFIHAGMGYSKQSEALMHYNMQKHIK